MSDDSSISMLHLLEHRLREAQQRNQAARDYSHQPPLIQTPGIGKAISSAYEQLRNAAEYAEEHLLLQRAIRRFYHRSLSFLVKKQHVAKVGEELIVELTQAGYLKNDTYGLHVAAQIQQLVEFHMHAFWQLRENHISREKAIEWTLDELAISSEELLNPHFQRGAIADFAYQHYRQTLRPEDFVTAEHEAQQYEICLFIAIHKALLKSDLPSVRHELIGMYQQSPHNLTAYAAFNDQVMDLYLAPLTEQLQRAISLHGAPLRILKSMADSNPALHEVLSDREAFMGAFRQQVSKEYKDLAKRINKGIIKSIIFLFITKVIIGLGVEVPYDLLVYGSVALLPLAINLLAPPLYMASLKLGLRKPSGTNARALGDYIERVLYTQESVRTYTAPTIKPISGYAKLLYFILFFFPFAVTVYILTLLRFNIVQAIIFFVFLSTASFLGFRLARMIRELELVTKQRGFLASLRDFFYLPFILVGQWISRKYARVNAVAFFLDMAIELPMKTILRLIRQWTRFLNERQDQLF